jgi:hypothetical protein
MQLYEESNSNDSFIGARCPVLTLYGPARRAFEHSIPALIMHMLEIFVLFTTLYSTLEVLLTLEDMKETDITISKLCVHSFRYILLGFRIKM